ncbi:BTAD domain-containing putative transcriptional regulator [Paracraurococcus lichenis]|uniref:BTAD domain-containing putative transcriptional regulator n=1 Tax=Paracraurococcus lichenis TaxID=3064888 RepID=A0ABT9DVP5_9PROT|nr:BTAD domain-containing putative transcriptional regulator [Paracraurococcus sp. LOR1-02]MDO9707975.1 BTAD domain-containing putative transcriptional regulator [Paracraurococcus sp. LOR1-02]
MGASLILAEPPQPGGGPAVAPSLRLVLIGRMEAWSLASVPALPRSRKARALLAMLGLAAGAPVPRARLGALLWSGRGEEQRRTSLRQALHELQEALAEAGAPAVVAGRDALALPAEQVWVDAVEVARAGAARPGALDLLTAELLADLDGVDPALDAWLAAERQRLRAHAAGEAQALLAAASEPGAIAAAARRLLAIDPGQEEAWRSLVRAELARGERGAALAACEACRAALAARHGAAPAAETEALERAVREGGLPAAPPAPAPRRGSARGARLGVLPLALLGTEAAEHLSAGLAEELTAALAALRWIFVVDSASLATEAGRSDPEAAARRLGLDFLLAGSVQRAGLRIRVTLRLTDLREAGGVVWTQRFDRDADDLLALQDEVAASVVARIDPEILLIEASRATARGPVGASAYDLLLRAIPALHRLDREGFAAAGRWLREAMALEPDYAPAQAWGAYWHLLMLGQGWHQGEAAAAMAEAERLATRAIALDPLDAQALTILGHVHAYLHHHAEEAVALHRRALALNPNLAMAWVFLSLAETYCGDHAAALRHHDRYRELAPCHPHAFFFDAARSMPLLALGRHAEAAEVCSAAIALQPGFSFPYKIRLAALGHLGRVAEAAAVRARLLAIEPNFTLAQAAARAPMRRLADRETYLKGLRLGGLA